MKALFASLASVLLVFGWIADHRECFSPQETSPQESSQASDSQDSAEQITAILAAQTKCWNDRDLIGFMASYWKSDKLTFSGGGQTTRGWQATLDRYQSKYPPEKMGTLTFDKQEITMLGSTAALVLGRWHLKTNEGPVEGNFSLVLKKFDGAWKIIHDHSSTLEVK